MHIAILMRRFTQVAAQVLFLSSALLASKDSFCLANDDDDASNGIFAAAHPVPVRNVHSASIDHVDTRQVKGNFETAKTDACGLLCVAPNVESGSFTKCLTDGFSADEEGPGDQRQLFWPTTSANWDEARAQNFGPKKSPAAVVYAESTADVSKAVKCASQYGYKVSARGRGHSFQGWGVIDGGLVIDMSRMCDPNEFVVDRDDAGPHILPGSKYIATMKAGAGCTNAVMLHAVHNKFQKEEGAMALIGGCPSVGITGYTLGGGMGDITSYVGLAADLLQEIEMVLYDGAVVTASEKEHPDLFWASRGGGGGNGIVTYLTYRIVQAPSPHFTQFIFKYTDPKTAMTRLQKYLYDTKSSSAKFGGTIFNEGGISYVIGIYLGSWEDVAKDMKGFGLLDDALFDNKNDPSTLWKEYNHVCGSEGKEVCSDADGVPPYGAEVSEYLSYAEMEGKVICRSTNLRPKWTKRTSNPCRDLGLSEEYCIRSSPPGNLAPFYPQPYYDLNCENKEVLERMLLVAGDPESFLNRSGAILPFTLDLTGLLLPRLEDKTIEAIVDAVDFNHFAHGAPMLVKPDATAFPWRNAGILTSVITQEKVNLLLEDKAFKNNPNKLQGYYNYMSPENPNWRRFYFDKNWERLTKVKGQYDPLNVFGKPITAETPLVPAGSTPKHKTKLCKIFSLFCQLFKKQKVPQAAGYEL